MNVFENILKGGDLRSIGASNKVVSLINDQQNFDLLFELLFNKDRKVVMRAADAIEKISISHPTFLQPHRQEIIELLNKAGNKELKWHLALIVPRLTLTTEQLQNIWQTLSDWATNKKESRIVRVNSLQGMFNIMTLNKGFEPHFSLVVSKIKKEGIPSLNARISKLQQPATSQKCSPKTI